MTQPGFGARYPLVDRALRLFEFLGRAQQLKTNPPRTIETYERDGAILWLADLPHHPAIHSAARGGDPMPGDTLLTVDRVSRLDPPDPDEALARWLDGQLGDPDHPPVLRESIVVPGIDPKPDEAATERLEIADQPNVRKLYDDWLTDWEGWADQELRDRPARQYYGDLFSTYVTATAHPEELELVAALGCLVWTPPGHLPVRRHLLTTPIAIHFDDKSGRLTVVQTETDGITVELDMLDPGRTNSPHITQVRTVARSLQAHPFHREEVGEIVRRLVHTLDADGEYLDQDTAPSQSTHAVAAFAPAVILRKRSQQGLIDIYRTIVEQLEEAGAVPDGVVPLIDPDHRPRAAGDSTPGAGVTVDDELYLPLPVNDVQRRIVQHVDRHAQTLVQGPPGTGKTHTAAALLSHLLAQGKRVLVTAHTDRALKEVRDKLPAEIKPLSVAVVGSSREDMSDLKVAVERIAAASAEHDLEVAERAIQECLTTIDQLARHKAQLYRTLLDAREREVREHEHAGYRGTLSAIAQCQQSLADRLGWLADYVRVPSYAEPLRNPEEIAEWRGYLLNADLAADEVESRLRLVDLSAVPEPAAFADLVDAECKAIADDERYATARSHEVFPAMSRLDAAARAGLKQRLHRFMGEASELARRREAWMNEALADVLTGRNEIWLSRGQQIASLIQQVEPLVARLGPTTDVRVMQGDVPVLVALATDFRAYVAGGGKLKVGPGGMPKVGSLTTRSVKQAQPLFEQVRINGLPPTTLAQLDAFLTWSEADRLLDALDRAWPETVHIPAEDTLSERLQWHVTEHKQLRQLLGFGEWLGAEDQRLTELGLSKPDWSSRPAVQRYASVVDAAAAREIRIAAEQPLQCLEQTISDAARWTDDGPCIHELLTAICQRDHDRYATAYSRLARLHDVRRMATRRDELSARISAAAPLLFKAIASVPAAPEWDDRLATFTEAWRWASTATWIREQSDVDVNVVQLDITHTEERIRRQVETLAATRAWNHAVSPERLGGKARADLEQYAYLVRKLGKGTGIHAAQRKADIRRAMDRCRPAVPVWIMPIYRIAEQLRIQPNMFDVVIVDEASQAGLEATFLQYLAPKMVVIGDDKQVSPTAIGVDHRQLRDLAAQYLADDPYIASWQDPLRSLFDEAKMRFGGLLTLTEHRRCVPEIIGFSNRIAYEPDGIRLIPVRQYGADRLEPIKAVFLQDGYTRGTTNKVNPVEVDAIVDQIEKCIADPRYDGLTFGVISLLGTAHAKTIEKALLDRIPPEEWRARDLRCGDSADFQGSERNVMFLSMVAAPDSGTRLAALTRDIYVQRYNVAASRAKDQMWLFHSIALSDVGNPEDMRFRLLDYCYGVINRRNTGQDGVLTEAVPNDRLVDPFDSLFEQRVFNRLVDPGYSVTPQFPSEGYRLDLVVVGAKTRLAIECDGDTWHGPDAYERDLARQRDLERCGWTIFRIRESAFYVDQPAVLAELWRTLDELDIHPSGWIPDKLAVTPEPAAASADITPEEPDDEPVTEEIETITHLTVPGTTPVPYEEFTGSVTAALDATTRELVEGLRAIVAIEGPVLGHRLHSAYVRASGGQKVGKLIANALNRAVTSAVRSGVLIEDNPLDAQGIRPRTYRLPNQPIARIRQLGPRSFEEVPPAELAALLSHTAESTGWDDEETLYRTTLGLLGLKRLTANVQDQFRQAHKLATASS